MANNKKAWNLERDVETVFDLIGESMNHADTSRSKSFARVIRVNGFSHAEKHARAFYEFIANLYVLSLTGRSDDEVRYCIENPEAPHTLFGNAFSELRRAYVGLTDADAERVINLARSFVFQSVVGARTKVYTKNKTFFHAGDTDAGTWFDKYSAWHSAREQDDMKSDPTINEYCAAHDAMVREGVDGKSFFAFAFTINDRERNEHRTHKREFRNFDRGVIVYVCDEEHHAVRDDKKELYAEYQRLDAQIDRLIYGTYDSRNAQRSMTAAQWKRFYTRPNLLGMNELFAKNLADEAYIARQRSYAEQSRPTEKQIACITKGTNAVDTSRLNKAQASELINALFGLRYDDGTKEEIEYYTKVVEYYTTNFGVCK